MTTGNEQGAALVTALMMTVLALVVALTVLYTVTGGIRVSASQKRYRSALAAAHGGVELFTREVMPRLLRQEAQEVIRSDFTPIGLEFPAPDCLRQKLNLPAASWTACSTPQTGPDPALAPDLSFTLGGPLPGAAGYQVTVKIVDTVPGNSDSPANELLEAGNAVSGVEEVVRPRHQPALFSIAAQGARGTSREKARLSLLYAY